MNNIFIESVTRGTIQYVCVQKLHMIFLAVGKDSSLGARADDAVDADAVAATVGPDASDDDAPTSVAAQQ